jgi:hypothetical protein
MSKHLILALVTCTACSAPAQNAHPTESPPSNPPPMTPPTPTPGQPAQAGDSPDCPAIQLKAPDAVGAGSQARFSAVLVGGPRSQSYTWSVSTGRIVSGQHAANLVVDTGGLAGASITATLEVGGLSTQCATTTASTSVLVGPAN